MEKLTVELQRQQALLAVSEEQCALERGVYVNQRNSGAIKAMVEQMRSMMCMIFPQTG